MGLAKERLDWLQGLRGVAAIAVVICHARFFLEGTRYFDESNLLLKSGESGVDLFFVISGFIMAFNLHGVAGGAHAAVSFAIRRLARIWPAYAVLTMITLAYKVIVGAHHSSIRDVLRSILFIPVHYSGLYLDQYMAQGWTLTFEVYFYITLAFCLVSGRFIWISFAIWMAVSLIVVPVCLNVSSLKSPFLPFEDKAYSIKLLTVICNPIIWEFIGGVVGGLAFRSRLNFGNPANATIMLWGSIAFTVLVIFDSDNTHGVFQWGIAFVQLVFIVAIASKTIPIGLGAALSKIGNASYTLYLVHLLVFDIVGSLVMGAGFGAIIPTPAYIVVITVICIGVALPLSKILEYRVSTLFFTHVEKMLPSRWRNSHRPLAELRSG